jgi:hypothetical protein
MKQLSHTLEAMKSNAALPKTPLGGSMMIDGQTITELLCSMAAEEINQKLKAALKSLPNCVLKIKKRPLNSVDHGFVRMQEVPEVFIDDPDALKDYQRQLMQWCSPCSQDRIKKEIYAMSLGMARRKDDDTDFKAMMIVYAADLAEYPADVIFNVCKELRRERRFFPTISDFRDACDERFEFRRLLKKEIDSVMNGQKRLGAPDPRIAMHWKDLAKKDWLAQHWDWYVSAAVEMVNIYSRAGDSIRADEWDAIFAQREAERVESQQAKQKQD